MQRDRATRFLTRNNKNDLSSLELAGMVFVLIERSYRAALLA